MNTVKVDIKNPSSHVIKTAVNILRSGGIIIYPTDTAYGIGANATDEKAIAKVYKIKERKFNKPTHVVVRDWNMIEGITITNIASRSLHDIFMPGPLTLILNKHEVVPNILTAGLPTLGIRIPDCKVTKLISEEFEHPYTTPSANEEGGKTPYSVDDVRKELNINLVDLVIDAGTLPQRSPSTLVDCSGKVVKVLREGEIKGFQITKVLRQVYKHK